MAYVIARDDKGNRVVVPKEEHEDCCGGGGQDDFASAVMAAVWGAPPPSPRKKPSVKSYSMSKDGNRGIQPDYKFDAEDEEKFGMGPRSIFLSPPRKDHAKPRRSAFVAKLFDSDTEEDDLLRESRARDVLASAETFGVFSRPCRAESV